MFSIEKLRIRYINEYAKLNDKRAEFNTLNEDFFKYYNKSNFIGKYLLRKQVCLIKNRNSPIGYLWCSKIGSNNGAYLVNALYIDREFWDQKELQLFSAFTKATTFYYDGKLNAVCSNFIESLEFLKKSETIELKLIISDRINMHDFPSVKFVTFKKGKHERIRCEIQNSIFSNIEREPLTLQDILMDELQDYYVNDWCIFLKFNNDFAGYGQIIMNNSTPLIVNFGLKADYRRMGLGDRLLTHLINLIFEAGYNEVRIKVNTDNIAAYELYKKKGFKIIDEYSTWVKVKK